MKPCVVVPVYNHGAPLGRTMDALSQFHLPVFVVDDCSDADTKRAIAAIVQRHPVTLMTRDRNGGKGAAVMDGLRAAANHGYTHAIQVDADGQHDLADLPKLLDAARENPRALVCGAPLFDDSVPPARLYGRRVTAFWVAIETLSMGTPDTMCGFRVYPLAESLELIDSVRMGRRMDFDIEIAVRLYWRGVPLVAVPTTVIYPAGGTSNFRLFRDNVLISRAHGKLVFGMLLHLPRLVRRRIGGGGHWSSVGERGGVLGMRILFAAYRVLGRWAFTLLLYPVVAYFCVAAGPVRAASRVYLRRVRDRYRDTGRALPTKLSTFRHVLEFGNAVLDKGATWAGTFSPADVEFADQTLYARIRGGRRGVLFVGSHLGNLEALRAFASTAQALPVNALVFTRHSPKFNRVMSEVCPGAAERMIQVDSLGPETVATLSRKLEAGEHVAIVADRVSVRHKERSIYVPFLGMPAPFPEGPFILASLLGCPVYLLFCLRLYGKYKVFIEPFADPLELPRARRRAALRDAVERYAQRLEEYCLMAPTQWFNFFNFWDQADVRAPKQQEHGEHT